MLDSQKHFDKVSSCHPPSGLIVEYDPLAGKYFYRCAECMKQCLAVSDEKLQFNQTFRADRNVRKDAYTGEVIMWKSEDATLSPEAVIAGSEAMDETTMQLLGLLAKIDGIDIMLNSNIKRPILVLPKEKYQFIKKSS